MKTAEMQREESQKEQGDDRPHENGRQALPFRKIFVGDDPDPDIHPSANGRQNRQIPENQAAEPETPNQVGRLLSQYPGGAQSNAERKQVREDSPKGRPPECCCTTHHVVFSFWPNGAAVGNRKHVGGSPQRLVRGVQSMVTSLREQKGQPQAICRFPSRAKQPLQSFCWEPCQN